MLKAHEDEDFFFLTFVGEYVEVTTKLLATAPEEHVTLPMTLRGFLLDKDDRFYYLGETPENIQHAIEQDMVAILTIVNQDAELDDILKDFHPEREEDIN